MLKQEGAFTFAKFVYKLTNLNSSSAKSKDASLKTPDCKVRSTVKSRPADDLLDSVHIDEIAETSSRRRRSRFLDYDDYDTEFFDVKDKGVGSFSL